MSLGACGQALYDLLPPQKEGIQRVRIQIRSSLKVLRYISSGRGSKATFGFKLGICLVPFWQFEIACRLFSFLPLR